MKVFLRNAPNKIIFFFLYFFTLLHLFVAPAKSQIIDSSFFDWTVYEIKTAELEPKICYISAYPTSSKSNHSSRKRPYIMITHYQETNEEEFSAFGGFDYKKNSEVFITVDNTQFKILAKGKNAWARTKYEDIKLIQTILKSAILKVRSDSNIGTYAVDEYSLRGITKAYLRMKEICK